MAVTKQTANLLLEIDGKNAGKTLNDLRADARNLRRLLNTLEVGSGDFNEVKKRLTDINKKIKESTEGMSGFKRQTGGVNTILKSAVGFLGGFSIVGILASLGQFIGRLFSLSSEMTELEMKTRTVFGNAESIVRGFAETNARVIGLSRRQYVDLATSVGDLVKPMGFAEDMTARLSAEIVNQAGILSEWQQGKISTQQATEILNKALLGERDALNSLGLDIKDSIIQAELKKKGLEGLTGESKRQAEALITLEQITLQSASANEAFANNSNSASRRQAEMRARLAELTDTLGKAFIPVMNKVLDFVARVVEAYSKWYKRLSDLWQSHENFRAGITAIFYSISAVVRAFADTWYDIVESVIRTMEGNFKGAIESLGNIVKRGFNLGSDMKMEFVKGWASVKNPDLKFPDNKGDAEKSGSKFAGAFGGGFDAEFARIKANAKKAPEDLAKIAKEALDKRLKEIEVGVLKEELALDTHLYNREISESDHGKKMLQLKEQQFNAQLEAFRRFNQMETKEALNAQKQLLEVQKQLYVQPTQGLAALPGRAPAPVTSQTSGAGRSDYGAAAEESVLIDKFQRIIDLEDNFELRRMEVRQNAIERQLEYLRMAGLQETEVFKKLLEEKLKLEEDFHAKRTENEKRSAELRHAAGQMAWDASKEAIVAGIELLSKDEDARRKHGSAIKALQIAQVQIDGIREIQGIWASVANIPPPFGELLGGIRTAVAIGRSVAAVNKILSTKYAGGGYTGRGYGSPDSTGFRPVGLVHEDEWVAPKWMATSPTLGPQIAALEAVRRRGFADGGYATDPTISAIPGPTGQQDASRSIMDISQEIKGLRQDLNRWKTALKATVVYTDIESAGDELNQARNDASI